MARTEEPERVCPVKSRPVPHLVCDRFLGRPFAAQVCSFAVANRSDFLPAVVTRHGVARECDPGTRRCLTFEGSLGTLGAAFLDAVRQLDPMARLGVEAPADPHLDLSLSAYDDGAFFAPHSDVVTGANRRFIGYDRLVTVTYYAHVPTARIQGGALILHPMVPSAQPAAIAPLNDRLVAFPSYAPHEVSRVSLKQASFAHARFALTYWLGRRLA